MICQSERLILRLLDHDDAPMILALLNEPSFIENIGDKGVRNLNDAKQYIDNGPLSMQKNLGFSMYCCQLRTTGEAIGLSGLVKRDGIEHPEIGFAFLPQYCQNGYGFESATAAITHANKQLNLPILQAICNPDNIASISLLTKLGFTYIKELLLPEIDTTIKLFEKGLIEDSDVILN